MSHRRLGPARWRRRLNGMWPAMWWDPIPQLPHCPKHRPHTHPPHPSRSKASSGVGGATLPFPTQRCCCTMNVCIPPRSPLSLSPRPATQDSPYPRSCLACALGEGGGRGANETAEEGIRCPAGDPESGRLLCVGVCGCEVSLTVGADSAEERPRRHLVAYVWGTTHPHRWTGLAGPPSLGICAAFPFSSPAL